MRAGLALLLALALAPGTWLRSASPPPDLAAPVKFTPMGQFPRVSGEIEILRAWRLQSENGHFGGFSALAAMPGGNLLAASDRGRVMYLDMPENGTPAARMDFLSGKDVADKHLVDVESITRDPASGQIWIGYEGANAIDRLDRKLHGAKRVMPPQMRGWSENSGPEAMVRLANGKFIVLAEGSRSLGKSDFPGVLFAGDPVEGAGAQTFRFAAPSGYRPVDMTQIPDGRVLVLVRKIHWGLPPRFTAKLLVADPADIGAGKLWQGRVIASFTPPVPSDNYEGLAAVPRADGALDLWMISDDNLASFQQTLLLRMRWAPGNRPKARPAR